MPETRAEIAARHHLLDGGLPRRLTLLSFTSGTTRVADRVHAADARAEHRARIPVHVLVAELRAHQPGVRPRLDRRDRRIAMDRVHREQLFLGEQRRRELVDALRNARRRCTRSRLHHEVDRAQAGSWSPQRGVEFGHAVRVGRDHAEPRDDDAAPHRGTPMPASGPSRRRLPSSSRHGRLRRAACGGGRRSRAIGGDEIAGAHDA